MKWPPPSCCVCSFKSCSRFHTMTASLPGSRLCGLRANIEALSRDLSPGDWTYILKVPLQWQVDFYCATKNSKHSSLPLSLKILRGWPESYLDEVQGKWIRAGWVLQNNMFDFGFKYYTLCCGYWRRDVRNASGPFAFGWAKWFSRKITVQT